MNEPTSYRAENGTCYIAVEKSLLGREKQNLILAIRLAREKISHLEAKMDLLDDSSAEYDELQDEKNDCELLVSDFEDRCEDLLNLSIG